MDAERFNALLQAFVGKGILVVGDFILDEYLIGETRRVSREAPVIVIDYLESRYHPGGAANAVQNICALGGDAVAMGVTGEDANGDVLRRVLAERGADVEGLLADSDIPTSVKTRILAGELHAQKQQVARIDRACRVNPDAAVLESIEGRLSSSLSSAAAVVLSDYGLGVLSPRMVRRVIELCSARGIPTVVDSRFDLTAFGGATVATPNEVELLDALDLAPSERRVNAAARRMIEEFDLGGLIVTRGSQGMLVFEGNAPPREIGIVGGRDATDVTGAGDTVAAAVALTLASGGDVNEAAEMATYAAAHVVMQRGTATVTPAQLVEVRARYPEPSTPEGRP